jgi:hypothetical protein
MVCFRRRYRKPIAAVVTACWLFALAASVVHACGLDANLGQASLAQTMNMSGPGGDDDTAPPGCDQFCADDFPLLAKLKLVQDQSGTQPLLISLSSVEPMPTSEATVASLSRSPDPPPVVAVNIRFLRLAL